MTSQYTRWTSADHSQVDDEFVAGVRRELDLLKSHYAKYLNEESLTNDIQCLTGWLNDYAKGSSQTAGYLRDYGMIILNAAHERLKTAADEINRFEGESPAAANFSGGKAHRLNDAAMHVSNMQDHLNQMKE